MIFNAYADTKQPTMGILPLSCGHIFAKEGRSIHRPAGRSDFLLFWSVSGEESFSFPTEKVTLHPGGFVLYAPGEPQLHETVSEHAEFYYMHFLASEALLSEFALTTSTVYDAPPAPEIAVLFEELLSEMQLCQPHHGAVCAALLYKILALLCRKKSAKHAVPPAYFDSISYIVSVLNREYAENRSLDDYAALVHMSKYHFSRIFQKVTGSSPIAYRNHLRLEHAKELLSDTRLSVAEIARRVGIDSPSYFHSFFLTHTGMSPSQWRKTGGV